MWNGTYRFKSIPKVKEDSLNGYLNKSLDYFIEIEKGKLAGYLMPEISQDNRYTSLSSNNQLVGISKFYENGISFKLKRGNIISDLNTVLKKRNDTIYLRLKYFNNESIEYWYMYKE